MTTHSPLLPTGSLRWLLGGASLALVLAQATLPTLPDEPAAKVATVAAHSGAVTLSAAAFLIAGTFLALALVALNALPVIRGRRLVRLGVIITAIGTMWPVAGRAAFNLVTVAISSTDPSSAAAAAKAIDNSGAFAVLLITLLAFVLGPLLLTTGLWRAQVAPLWPAVLWLVGVASVNAAEGSSRLLATAGMALVAAALLWIGAAASGYRTRTEAATPVLGIST